MKRIMQYNQQRRDQAAASHPFILWLQDESIPVKDRLAAWLPHLSVFAFGFKDLNNILLPYPESEAALDSRKQMINDHCAQDGTHWHWYLEDLNLLNLNSQLKFTEGLHYLWDEDRKLDRLFMYKVCALLEEAKDPLLRYCIIAPFEFFAHLLFDITAQLAREYKAESGIDLTYLGDKHSIVEPGGLVDNQHEITDETDFLEAELESDFYDKGMEISIFMADQIEARWQGNLDYILKTFKHRTVEVA